MNELGLRSIFAHLQRHATGPKLKLESWDCCRYCGAPSDNAPLCPSHEAMRQRFAAKYGEPIDTPKATSPDFSVLRDLGRQWSPHNSD